MSLPTTRLRRPGGQDQLVSYYTVLPAHKHAGWPWRAPVSMHDKAMHVTMHATMAMRVHLQGVPTCLPAAQLWQSPILSQRPAETLRLQLTGQLNHPPVAT